VSLFPGNQGWQAVAGKNKGWTSMTVKSSRKRPLDERTKVLREAAKTEHIAKVAKWFEEFNQKPG
jgi:hypothetical protein